MDKDKKLKPLYIIINALLLGLLAVLLVRISDRTAESYMAALAAFGAFSAFNGYWSINPKLYSWFHRERVGGSRMFLTLTIAGTTLLALCIIWLFL